MNNEQFAIVDTETTNLWTVRPEDGSHDYSKVVITDIGIILLDNIFDKEPIECEFSFGLSPDDLKQANPESLKINGYDHSNRAGDAETGSAIATQTWTHISTLLRNRVIVASNAEFDVGAIRSNLIRHGVLKPKGGIPGEEWESWSVRRCVDTNAFGFMMKQAFNLKSASVQESYNFLANVFNLPMLEGHRALADAQKAYEVFKFAHKRFKL
jgi:DNA polymerase III epsilon subunit-like protein